MIMYWPQLVGMQLCALANMPLLYVGFNLYHTTTPFITALVLISACVTGYILGSFILDERGEEKITAPELLARYSGRYGRTALIFLATSTAVVWMTVHSGFLSTFIIEGTFHSTNTLIIMLVQFLIAALGILLGIFLPKTLYYFGGINALLLIALTIVFFLQTPQEAVAHPTVSFGEAFKPIISLFLHVLIVLPSLYRYAANNAECRKGLIGLFIVVPSIVGIGWYMAYVSKMPDLVICCSMLSPVIYFIATAFFAIAGTVAVANNCFVAEVALSATHFFKKYRFLISAVLSISIVALVVSGMVNNVLRGVELAGLTLASAFSTVIMHQVRIRLDKKALASTYNLIAMLVGVGLGICCFAGWSIVGTKNAMLDSLVGSATILLVM